MSVAFFDLDKTLIAANSATLWVRKELREGTISYWQFTRALVWLFRYALGDADVEGAVRESISTLAGKTEASIRQRAQEFFDAEVRALVRPGARPVIATHRQRGERVVLLTSTSPYVSELVTRELGLDHYLCTRFVVRDGVFTGEAEEPLCFGTGKVRLARAYLEPHGVALAGCAFYSDSASDLPMLEAVGRPVAVHPDPKLKRLAQRRRWPIADWGAPGA